MGKLNASTLTTKMTKDVIWSVKLITSNTDLEYAAIHRDGVKCSDEFLGVAEKYFGTNYDENDGEYIWPGEQINAGYLMEFQEEVQEHIDNNFNVLCNQQIG